MHGALSWHRLHEFALHCRRLGARAMQPSVGSTCASVGCLLGDAMKGRWRWTCWWWWYGGLLLRPLSYQGGLKTNHAT